MKPKSITYFDENAFLASMGRRGLPRPGKEPPEGWSKQAPDPMRMLKGHPHLKIRKGFVLRAYQFYEGGNGNAFVFAMPKGAPLPDPNDVPGEKRLWDPPCPPEAMPDFMSVIEGDGSPASYLSASMFARDVSELGAFWHGCGWSTHRILFSDPLVKEESLPRDWWDKPEFFDAISETGWRWTARRPKKWHPRVTWRKGLPCVTFFTFCGLGGQTITRFTDTFGADSYDFETEVGCVAEGPGGYVF